MSNSLTFAAIVVLVVAGISGYTLVEWHASSSGTTPGPNSTLTVTNVSLQITHSYLCGMNGGQCTPIPAVVAYATVFVHATSPLSCLDTYVNGTMEGEGCWNLISPGFPYTECSGNGNETTCITTYRPNNNTLTTRTFPDNTQIVGFNGTNGGPVIREGGTYLLTYIAHFEDGSSSSASVTVVATLSRGNSTSPISVETSTTTVAK